MRLAIYSDLHVEFSSFEPPADLEADLVILAGDIYVPGSDVPTWARRKSVFGDRPVVCVAGNHEFYGSRYERQRERMESEARRLGVHYLQMGCVVIGGVRFLGTTLWTDFDLRILQHGGLVRDRERAMDIAGKFLNDYQLIRIGQGRRSEARPLRPAQTRHMHLQERDWLLQELRKPFEGATVVVTHHAPHRNSIARRFEDDWLSGCFASELPDEFFEVPRLWVHGHTHDSADYTVGNCRVLCNPRGYPLRMTRGFENDAFDEWLVVEI
jgi:Icc-related predicted phosphoesterase